MYKQHFNNSMTNFISVILRNHYFLKIKNQKTTIKQLKMLAKAKTLDGYENMSRHHS